MGKSSNQTSAMSRAIERLSRLPGIGKRSAERIAFYLLKADPQEAQQLAGAINDLRTQSIQCSRCWNIAESDPCPVCTDPQRDHATILVVEQPGDVASLEATGIYRGLYHVLWGRLAALEGIGPGDLTIGALVDRVREARSSSSPIHEVILGTNPTLEGDGTALYLAQKLEPLGVRVSRLARGVPTGSTLETVSKAVLADAVAGRQGMTGT